MIILWLIIALVIIAVAIAYWRTKNATSLVIDYKESGATPLH